MTPFLSPDLGRSGSERHVDVSVHAFGCRRKSGYIDTAEVGQTGFGRRTHQLILFTRGMRRQGGLSPCLGRNRVAPTFPSAVPFGQTTRARTVPSSDRCCLVSKEHALPNVTSFGYKPECTGAIQPTIYPARLVSTQYSRCLACVSLPVSANVPIHDQSPSLEAAIESLSVTQRSCPFSIPLLLPQTHALRQFRTGFGVVRRDHRVIGSP
jgi:hypothetical protein